jgi:hypothetical protein
MKNIVAAIWFVLALKSKACMLPLSIYYTSNISLPFAIVKYCSIYNYFKWIEKKDFCLTLYNCPDLLKVNLTNLDYIKQELDKQSTFLEI